MLQLLEGFYIIVSDVRIVSVAELFVKRSGRLYGNTLASISNDPYVRKYMIVQIEPCPIGSIGDDRINYLAIVKFQWKHVRMNLTTESM